MYVLQRLGGIEKVDSSHYIDEAVSLAKQADVVVFVAGLNFEWESEGFDRSTLNMPGEQDETIAKIAEANPNTIVVVQCVRSSPPCPSSFLPSCSDR